jgi:hypothetical protein
MFDRDIIMMQVTSKMFSLLTNSTVSCKQHLLTAFCFMGCQFKRAVPSVTIDASFKREYHSLILLVFVLLCFDLPNEL